ncbi:MAG: malate dehydrogenase [Elusimicrobia bacterium RIFOXYB2_FULL_49_7]|nr:MAG: malate dehydrogenase [Elusimicrobia bacterium RIFOXYB2_FULL_49_7]
MARKKIALIGGGQIGGNLALFALQQQLGDIVLYDIPDKEALCKGKALDILEMAPVNGSTGNILGTHRLEDCENADVVIVTAGLPRKPGMSREDLLRINLGIITGIAGKLKTLCPNAFHIIITNPLDSMVYAYQKAGHFPAHKVVGMAGVLDSARFCAFVAMELNVSVRDVQALVLGGHGPTMVPLSRLATVGGVPVPELIPADKLKAIEDRTREAGTEIVQLYGNGSAYFSPAGSAIVMAESYLKDLKRVLPCAACCNGEYGVQGLYVGVPAIIGAGGIEKILEVKLTREEKAAFDKTAETVKKSVAETGL